IRGPIGAELEFHDYARRYTDGESQREHPGPEPGHLMINVAAGLEPKALHENEHHTEADAQRREKVMKRNGQPELNSRKRENGHLGLKIRACSGISTGIFSP